MGCCLRRSPRGTSTSVLIVDPLTCRSGPTIAARFHLVRLPGLSRPQPHAARQFAAGEIQWGVRRRAGYGQMDDPMAHRGRMQHAFLTGVDSLAICGYKPFRWRQRHAVPLAVPTTQNQHCHRCWSYISYPQASVILVDPQARIEGAHATSRESWPAMDAVTVHRSRRPHRRGRRPRIVAVRQPPPNSRKERTHSPQLVDKAA